jgi:Uri superfamily endonuclease
VSLGCDAFDAEPRVPEEHALAPIQLTPRPDANLVPGSYALVLVNVGSRTVCIGALGRLDLRPGFYIYVGSALGPGGLQARIRRHLDPAPPLHWHIDYLKRAARIVEIWSLADPVRREHAWASALASLPNASIPMPGFGSSDCDCPAHLFHFPTAPKLAAFARALRRAGVDGRQIEAVSPRRY